MGNNREDVESNSGSVSSVSSRGSDENKDRGNWSGNFDFFLSCVGYAVGIGNVWRFPYLCYRNGGGAFLVPYLLALFICGLPLFFMEVALGQFSSCGAIEVWKMSPILQGAGYGTVVVTGICCVYYNVLIAYILFYMVMSFAKTVPWADCDNWWNTINCVRRGVDSTGLTQLNGTNVSTDYIANNTAAGAMAMTVARNGTPTTPSEEFWYNFILNINDGLGSLDGVHWKLLLALFVAYVIVFLCICKGVKSTGKVVYFTATFPYVVLTILLVRGVTLPGAADGLYYYLMPDWKLMCNFEVWGLAFIQIFYSLGPGWGGIITMSSYNRFHNNLLMEAYLVPVINSFTSVYAGFAVFSILGYMANIAQVPVSKVVTGGPGLAFMVYPEALTHLPISPMWAIFFFFMLFMLGLDTQFVMIETVITAVWDMFASKLKKGAKVWITLGVCVIMFIAAIPLTTRAGSYIFTIMDWYAAGYSVMVISLCEVLVVGWAYGTERLLDEIEFMVGRRVYGRIVFTILWKVIVPLLLGGILIISVVTHTPVTYLNYTFPTWAIVFGWSLGMCSILCIPVFAICYVVNGSGTILQRLRKGFTPSEEWGPAVPAIRADYECHFKKGVKYCAPEAAQPQELKKLNTNSTSNGDVLTSGQKPKSNGYIPVPPPV